MASRTCKSCGMHLSRHSVDTSGEWPEFVCPVLGSFSNLVFEGTASGSYTISSSDTPKFVSVSLTPEARDALKAETAKQIGETGVSLSMSDALLAVIAESRKEDTDMPATVEARLQELEVSNVDVVTDIEFLQDEIIGAKHAIEKMWALVFRPQDDKPWIDLLNEKIKKLENKNNS